MEHKKDPSNMFLLKNNTNTTQDVVTDSDYNSDVPVHISSIPDQNQSGSSSFTKHENSQQTVVNPVNPDDILRNGILVETNKGVVCMSLKDVLSSNLNLSVDDFKKVAVQLLSQDSDNPVSKTQKEEPTDPVLLNNFQSNEFFLNSYYDPLQSTSTATSEAVDTSEETDSAAQPPKRRGGWPKGRKRKPELLNLPPKAPKTSYNIFLNERRKLYKDKLAFHEITRVVGNLWSNLTAEQKRPYIERAEEDKKRYREELQIYRRSDAYKLYLARKRKKRALDNLLSESDMDGTDDIDDEDNDMLYCDTCDQWFYNMHNKREHLQSRQHKLTVAGDVNKISKNRKQNNQVFANSLDESSLDATDSSKPNSDTESVHDHMVRLIGSVTKREKEINVLKCQLVESKSEQDHLVSELNLLKQQSNMFKSNLSDLKKEEVCLEQQLIRLWNVPSLFVINNVEFVN